MLLWENTRLCFAYSFRRLARRWFEVVYKKAENPKIIRHERRASSRWKDGGNEKYLHERDAEPKSGPVSFLYDHEQS